MPLRSVLLSTVFLALLAACDTTVTPPAESPSASTANFHTRVTPASGTAATPQAQENPGPRAIPEDEAEQTLLDTTEKMVKQGDATSAIVLYHRAIAANPHSTHALAALAKLYESQNRPREALESWRAIVAIDDQNAEAHRGMGRDLMGMGLYKKAIDELKKAHEIGGEDDLKTVNLLAMAELRAGDATSAIATLKDALKDNDDLVTRNNLGFAYIMAGDTDSAIATLEDVAKDPKATAQQRQNLALAYGLAGREEDARAMALQDLPPAAVENNLKTYRLMRDKLAGKPVAMPVVEKKKPVKKKKAAAKKEVKKEEKPAAAPTPAPVAPVAPPAPTPAPAPAPSAPAKP